MTDEGVSLREYVEQLFAGHQREHVQLVAELDRLRGRQRLEWALVAGACGAIAGVASAVTWAVTA